jgi:RNA polymerase sigma-70 factor (ECF subfamily)
MDEHRAVESLKRGEISALEMLVERYYTKAARVAYLITQDAGMAEDVAQEAFVRVFQRIDQFDQGRPFEPWFMRSVCNAAIKAARRQARQVSLDQEVAASEGLTFGELLTDQEPAVEEQVDGKLTRERIGAALAALPPRQRAAVVQRYYLGLNEREMSAALGSPAGTVKWLLSAARRNLRALLQSSRRNA